MCPETKSQISIRVPSTTPIIHYLWTPVQGVVVPGPRGRHWCSPPSRRADGIKTGRAKLLNQPCVLFEHEAMLLCPGSASHANIETWTVDTRPCPALRRPGTALTPTCHSTPTIHTAAYRYSQSPLTHQQTRNARLSSGQSPRQNDRQRAMSTKDH